MKVSSYSSDGAGAAVVDNVTYKIGAGATVSSVTSRAPARSTTTRSVSAKDAWKSTGKPPAIFHHPHRLSDLIYTDLCGQPGDVSRICDLNGVVISAGDHDNSEAAGGLIDGTAERGALRRHLLADDSVRGSLRPACRTRSACSRSTGTPAARGSATRTSTPRTTTTSTTICTPASWIRSPRVSLWRFGFMSYPGNSTDLDGRAPIRIRRGARCASQRSSSSTPISSASATSRACVGNSMMKTSNASGVPDSVNALIWARCRSASGSACRRAARRPTAATGTTSASTIVDGPRSPGSPRTSGTGSMTPSPRTRRRDSPVWRRSSTPARPFSRPASTRHRTRQHDSGRHSCDSVVIVSSPTTTQVDMIFRILPVRGTTPRSAIRTPASSASSRTTPSP